MIILSKGAISMPDTFAVIAEPSRRRILDLLLQSESNVTDLAQALGLSQPLVSKHLRTLRQSGLVKVRIKSQQHIYSLEAEPLAEIDEWLKAYRKKWNRHVDALENFLDQQKKIRRKRNMRSPIENPKLMQEQEDWVLVLKRVLNHPPEKVWDALTRADQVPKWGPFSADKDLTEVGAVRLKHINTPEAEEMEGYVLEVNAPHLLVFRWGADILRWELAALGKVRRPWCCGIGLRIANKRLPMRQAGTFAWMAWPGRWPANKCPRWSGKKRSNTVGRNCTRPTRKSWASVRNEGHNPAENRLIKA